MILLLNFLAFKYHVQVGAVVRIIALSISSSLFQDIILAKSRCFALHGLVQHPRITRRIWIGLTLVQHQTARLALQLEGDAIISNMRVGSTVIVSLVQEALIFLICASIGVISLSCWLYFCFELVFGIISLLLNFYVLQKVRANLAFDG